MDGERMGSPVMSDADVFGAPSTDTSKPMSDAEVFGGTPSHEAKTPMQKQGGFWRNVGAGLEEIPAGLEWMAAHATGPSPASLIPGLDKMDAEREQTIADAGQKTTKAIGRTTGLDPEQVSQDNFTDSLGRNLGQNALAFIPGLGEEGLANKARSATTGLGSVLGQTAVQQIAPDSPLAQTAGALVGGLATGKAAMVPSTIKRALTTATDAERGTGHLYSLMQNQGLSPDDIQAFGDASHGKPVMGAEALGPAGLGAMKAAGVRQGQTGRALQGAIDERIDATPDRIMDDFQGATGVDPHAALGDIQTVVKTGRAAARPLYEKSFDGSGTGIGAYRKPLEDMFNTHSRAAKDAHGVVQDAERNLMLVEGRATRASHSEPWQRLGIADERTAAQQQLANAQGALQQAEAAKAGVVSKMRDAQAEEAAGVKGGVWSPRVQQFLDDPILKRGLARGMEVQRLEALSEGVPFNPREYAVKGMEADGTPQISGVPNMRLLDAGKRGLDSIINDFRDKTTGKLPDNDERLSAIMDVRKAYVDELKGLNPDYKAALDKSSDYLRAKNSFDTAQKMFSNRNVTGPQMQKYIDGLGDVDKRAATGGIANWVLNQAENGALKGKTFDRPRLQQKLRAAIGDPKKADAFLQKMEVENDMRLRSARMSPGLNSTTFDAADAAAEMDKPGAAMDAGHAVLKLGKGDLSGAVRKGASALDKIGAFARTPGLNVGARDEVGRLGMLPPAELADSMRGFGASRLAQALAKPKFPARGLIPAAMPAITANSQQPYRKGGFVS